MSGGADSALDVDAVVIGAGMGGLTVAASLAQSGALVAVLEAAEDVGGSAALSEGYVWTAPTEAVFVAEDPAGDIARYRRMRAELDAAFAWLEGLGVAVGPELTQVLGFGTGRQIDIAAFIARAVAVIETAGGFVARGTEVDDLVHDGGTITGVRIAGEGDVIGAPVVVIATGGFQASAAARAEWMGEPARSLVLRSNPRSRGDGIALGVSVGADVVGPRDGFYGHLVPVGIDDFSPRDYAALAQYYSDHGLLLARTGERFADESLGDHVNAIEVAARGSALLVVDERIRRDEVVRAFIPGMDAIDKIALAAGRGARTASAPTPAELGRAIDSWGYDGARAAATIEDFGRAMAERASVEPPRHGHRVALVEPPFAAIEVEAAITFTYLGLEVDPEGRVLRDGAPIPGLFAAGADQGGLNVRGYTGGLVRGLALGRITAAAIAAELREREDGR